MVHAVAGLTCSCGLAHAVPLGTDAATARLAHIA
jgi:hypothetical protein